MKKLISIAFTVSILATACNKKEIPVPEKNNISIETFHPKGDFRIDGDTPHKDSIQAPSKKIPR